MSCSAGAKWKNSRCRSYQNAMLRASEWSRLLRRSRSKLQPPMASPPPPGPIPSHLVLSLVGHRLLLPVDFHIALVVGTVFGVVDMRIVEAVQLLRRHPHVALPDRLELDVDR